MELKTVIETILIILMIVAVGLLVIALVQGFVADGGLIHDFFTKVITAITTKGETLISGLSV